MVTLDAWQARGVIWTGETGRRIEGELTGLYLRGKTFWFTYRLDCKKHFHRLGTADYGEAVQKALELAGVTHREG